MLAVATILCKIAGKRENNRGNGLEVPYIFNVKGPRIIAEREEMIIVNYLNRSR